MHDFLYYLTHLFQRGLGLALPGVLVCAAALGVVWGVCRKRGRPFPWKKALALLLLAGWLLLTVYATLLRGEPGYRSWNLHLFLAWRQAWNKFTLQIWLNVLLNIALFVPLGVLLPLLSRRFSRWYAAFAAGLCTSLAIEAAQLATGRGMFDVDDLFTNTLGAMLGWSAVMAVLVLVRREGAWKRRFAACLAIPAAFLLAMGGIFAAYQFQPYGNLPDAPVVRADLSGVTWTGEDLSQDAPNTAWVYQVGWLDQAACDQLSRRLADQFSVQFPDAYYYDDTILYANHSTGDFLDVTQRSGTWCYTIGREKRPLLSIPADQVGPDDLRPILASLGIQVPEDAELTLTPWGREFFRAVFTAAGEDTHGTLTCSLQCTEAGTQLKEVDNQLVTFTPCRKEPILTPAQAMEQLRSGRSFAGSLIASAQITQVEVLSCTLDWLADSKGFYQPVYRFTLDCDQWEPWTDYVAALA